MAILFGSDSDALAGVFPGNADAGQRYLNSDLLAAALAAPYARLGVLRDVLDEFSVEHSTGMRITIGHGFALVGTRDNPAPVINYGGPTGMTEEAITIPDGDATERIDLISIRAQFGTVNKVSVERTAGTPGSGSAPTAPSQTDDDYYLPIATVAVPASASSITDDNITNLDTRFAQLLAPTGIQPHDYRHAIQRVLPIRLNDTEYDPYGVSPNDRLQSRDADRIYFTNDTDVRRYTDSGYGFAEQAVREANPGQNISAGDFVFSHAVGGAAAVAFGLFENAGNLWAIALDLRTSTVTGKCAIVENASGVVATPSVQDIAPVFSAGNWGITLSGQKMMVQADGSHMWLAHGSSVYKLGISIAGSTLAVSPVANSNNPPDGPATWAGGGTIALLAASDNADQPLVGRRTNDTDGVIERRSLTAATATYNGWLRGNIEGFLVLGVTAGTPNATLGRIHGVLCWVMACSNNEEQTKSVYIAPVANTAGTTLFPFYGEGQR